MRPLEFVLIGVLLLIGLVPASSLAQSSLNDKQNTRMIDSFGSITDDDMRHRIDLLLAEVATQTNSKGLIVNYGSPAEVAARKRQFQNQLSSRAFDVSLIDFRTGGNVSERRTDLWVIPKNGTPPNIKPEAWIGGTFGKVYKKQAFGMIRKFFSELFDLPNHQGYIINYGTPKQIALREKWITEQVTFRGVDRPRITLVNGGTGDVRTTMWLVPPRAEYPKP